MSIPEEWRVTPRVPAPVAFTLRLLLVIAVVALVVLVVYAGAEINGHYIRWQVTR